MPILKIGKDASLFEQEWKSKSELKKYFCSFGYIEACLEYLERKMWVITKV